MNLYLLSKKYLAIEKRILAAIRRAARKGRVAIFFAVLFCVISSSRSRHLHAFEPAASSEITRPSNASWYSTECCRYNPTKGCPTASGKSLYALEREQIDFAASWFYPMGTRLKVTNDRNGKSVTVTVLDRGPAKRLRRAIDLSRSAFQKISDLKKGVIRVRIEQIKPGE